MKSQRQLLNLDIIVHAGTGETSLAKLIAHFYEAQSGLILIDGMNIASPTCSSTAGSQASSRMCLFCSPGR